MTHCHLKLVKSDQIWWKVLKIGRVYMWGIITMLYLWVLYMREG